MKFKLWNRLLVALSGLILFLLGVCAFLFSVGFLPSFLDLSALNVGLLLWQRIVILFSALLLCLLGVHDLWLLFTRKGEKGFIMQRTELGDMSISMNALETMVHKCVDQHKELLVKSTRIFRVKNGIVVEIRIVLATGVNIPLTVNALQKQIKQYIISCSGVEVYEVKVLVETNLPRQHHPKEQRELVLDARKPQEIETSSQKGPANEPTKTEPVVPAVPVDFQETVPVAAFASEAQPVVVSDHSASPADMRQVVEEQEATEAEFQREEDFVPEDDSITNEIPAEEQSHE